MGTRRARRLQAVASFPHIIGCKVIIIAAEILYLRDIFPKKTKVSILDKIPAHVAIIMDGNGRWARQRGEERVFGHTMGVETVRRMIKAAASRGISYLTLYVFSTENWGRPQQEVDMLMELLCKSVIDEVEELKRQGARVRIIGDRSRMSEKVNEHLDLIIRETAEGDRITVILAINYSARSEIAHAARLTAEKVLAGALKPEDITEEAISRELYTAPYPDPDLIIRTGGEQRLSNFLLWQGAYSELYFTDTFWPDFGEEDLDKALADYAGRERRFGKVLNA